MFSRHLAVAELRFPQPLSNLGLRGLGGWQMDLTLVFFNRAFFNDFEQSDPQSENVNCQDTARGDGDNNI